MRSVSIVLAVQGAFLRETRTDVESALRGSSKTLSYRGHHHRGMEKRKQIEEACSRKI